MPYYHKKHHYVRKRQGLLMTKSHNLNTLGKLEQRKKLFQILLSNINKILIDHNEAFFEITISFV